MKNTGTEKGTKTKRLIGTGAVIAKNGIYAMALMILLATGLCWIMQIKPAVVTSGSMEPAIKTGSLILINERDKDIEVDDIIAFEAGKLSVAHRVVEVTDKGFVTKGDSNRTKDLGVVTEDMVKGTVVLDIPKVGYLLKWTKSIAAYLTGGDSADNTMTVGHNTISILEEFIPPDKLQPGAEIPKKVNIQNTGDVPCAVRVAAEFSDSYMEQLAELDVDSEYWEYGDDGYYYYKEILGVADISHTLFNTVTISSEASASQLKDFDIMVYAESKNAKEGDSYSDIKW